MVSNWDNKYQKSSAVHFDKIDHIIYPIKTQRKRAAYDKSKILRI